MQFVFHYYSQLQFSELYIKQTKHVIYTGSQLHVSVLNCSNHEHVCIYIANFLMQDYNQDTCMLYMLVSSDEVEYACKIKTFQLHACHHAGDL